MKKHYATHVEDTDKLISVAGPILEYETWYEQYKYLIIGSNGNHFTKIALKNLAIYNHILSKDDCIKAYDYLQTLKAK